MNSSFQQRFFIHMKKIYVDAKNDIAVKVSMVSA